MHARAQSMLDWYSNGTLVIKCSGFIVDVCIVDSLNVEVQGLKRFQKFKNSTYRHRLAEAMSSQTKMWTSSIVFAQKAEQTCLACDSGRFCSASK
jgi:hypothetical protein